MDRLARLSPTRRVEMWTASSATGPGPNGTSLSTNHSMQCAAASTRKAKRSPSSSTLKFLSTWTVSRHRSGSNGTDLGLRLRQMELS